MSSTGGMSIDVTLPRPGGPAYLTDGGLETCLVFHDGIDLPAFASFPLVTEEAGRERLRTYYAEYLATAERLGLGFVLEAPTWRANPDWGASIGYDLTALEVANRAAVALMDEIRRGASGLGPIVVSGCIGPRGDGYVAGATPAADAAAYHARQIGWLGDAGADLVSALTIGSVEEAVGVTTAAARQGIPVVVSFTVETDGRLPSGTPLGEAIEATDDATGGYTSYFMVNCAHPSHLTPGVASGGAWVERIAAYRPNASTLSHAELDEASELDEGDPTVLAGETVDLLTRLPALAVLGGCCGTDHRHVEAIATAWVGAGLAAIR
jgi:S-methylmethionine-dependent homocysteine/selenocysteine methylase